MVIWADKHGSARFLVDAWVFHVIVNVFVITHDRIGVLAFGEIEQEAVYPHLFAKRMGFKVILNGEQAADIPDDLYRDVFFVFGWSNRIRHEGILIKNE